MPLFMNNGELYSWSAYCLALRQWTTVVKNKDMRSI